MSDRTKDAATGDPIDQLAIGDISFNDLMVLEPHGPDTYVGRAPRYPWGRLFGGQVVAQGLRAAQLTVDPAYAIHSLHAYFIRGGTHREPVRFEVDRIRNGRSFITRRVVARQSNGAILNLSASFQIAEEAPDVQPLSAPAGLAAPGEIDDMGWGAMLERRNALNEFGHTSTYVRLAQDIDDEPGLAACALAFISDAVPTGAVRATHPIQVADPTKRHERFMGASLDHTVYFHRPVDPTQWILADVVCHTLVGARGLTVANLFDPSGGQAATVVQEVLLRERKPDAGANSDGLGGKEA